MDEYIINRLRADAKHVLELSEQQVVLQHQGIKGRFRELLINNLLAPWLPPYCGCGTGMIIQGKGNKHRNSTQDDIIVYDKFITPPVLVSPQAPEGIYLYNSVLLRTEVKSKVNATSIKEFVASSKEMSQFKFQVQEGCRKEFVGAINTFVGFATDLTNDDPDSELRRFIKAMEDADVHPLSGTISVICIPGRGLWKLIMGNGNRKVWGKLTSSNSCDHLVGYVGVTSSTCFQLHTQRIGNNPVESLESGIGEFLSPLNFQPVANSLS